MKYLIYIILCMSLAAGCAGRRREAPSDPYEGVSQVSGIIKDVKFLESVSSYSQPIVVTFEDGRIGNFTLWIANGPFVFDKGKRNTIITNPAGLVVRVVQDE